MAVSSNIMVSYRWKWWAVGMGVILIGIGVALSLISGVSTLNQLVIGTSSLGFGLILLISVLLAGRRHAGVWIETAALVIFFLGFFRILASIAGGPFTSDEMFYMDAAQNLQPQAFIIGRYSHIYLIKLFSVFAGGDVFLGARLLWAFLIAATSIMIYLPAKQFLSDNGPLAQIGAGILSVILFLSLPFLKMAGPIYSDFTAMLFFGVGILLYLLIFQMPLRQNILLAAFGFLLVIATDAKEVCAMLGALLLGLGFQEDLGFNLKLWFKRMIWVFLGILGGLLLFVILDGLLLNHPFFHLNLNNWLTMQSFNIDQETEWDIVNYFSYMATTGILPMLIMTGFTFLVFLQQGRLQNTKRIIWLVPLAIVFFYTIIRHQNFERYIIPIYPLVCIFAAQVIHFKLKPGSYVLKMALGVIGMFAVVFAIQIFWLLPYLREQHFRADIYYSGILLPLTVVGLLTVFILTRRWLALPILLLFFFLVNSMAIPLNNTLTSWSTFEYPKKSVARFAVLDEFKDKIQLRPDLKVFMSSKNTFSWSEKSSQVMFNLFFKTTLDQKQVGYGSFDTGQFISQGYDYGFLSTGEWDNLDQADRILILREYNLTKSKTPTVLFLEKKTGP